MGVYSSKVRQLKKIHILVIKLDFIYKYWLRDFSKLEISIFPFLININFAGFGADNVQVRLCPALQNIGSENIDEGAHFKLLRLWFLLRRGR